VDVPLTLQTFPDAYSDRVLEIADQDRSGQISMVEWTNAGGDKRSFLLADQNKDGVVTRSELIRISSSARFMDFTRSYADQNRYRELTVRELHTAGGVRVLRFDF